MTNRRQFESNRGETVSIRFERGLCGEAGEGWWYFERRLGYLFYLCMSLVFSMFGVQIVEIVSGELVLW